VDPLVLKFGGSLVEQLGAQLYPSVTATVAELISNAWDADATKVWVEIPLTEEWSPGSQIVVTDNGHGMTRDEAQDAYLVVGRKRRLVSGVKSRGGRLVHGRKGIGKLAAFGTARILECSTLSCNSVTHFRLDYDAIRKLTPDKDYVVEASSSDDPVTDPITGKPLAHGTRIRLSGLKHRRSISGDQFLSSMTRRFAIDANAMSVLINGSELLRAYPKTAQGVND